MKLRDDLDALASLCADARPPSEAEAWVRRDTFARLAVRTLAARALIADDGESERLGQARATDPVLAKLVFSELDEDMAGFGLSVQGYAKAYTIAGGSSEIMRNLLPARVSPGAGGPQVRSCRSNSPWRASIDAAMRETSAGGAGSTTGPCSRLGRAMVASPRTVCSSR